MTEKRFVFVIDNGEDTFYDLSENGKIMNMIDTEEMLNELNDENERLKKDVEFWKQSALQYSNELNVFEHRKKRKIIKRDYTSMGLYDSKTEKDNEELKK